MYWVTQDAVEIYAGFCRPVWLLWVIHSNCSNWIFTDFKRVYVDLLIYDTVILNDVLWGSGLCQEAGTVNFLYVFSRYYMSILQNADNLYRSRLLSSYLNHRDLLVYIIAPKAIRNKFLLFIMLINSLFYCILLWHPKLT